MNPYPEKALGEFLSLDVVTEPINLDRTYVTAGIYSYGRGLFKRPAISGSETRYSRYTRLREGQFVFSKLFGWEGALATVTPEFDGLYVSSEFPTFRIDETIADRRYVSHLARWSGLHGKLRDKGTGMGSRRQRVNVDRLLAATAPMPELNEQRRIADRLDVASARLATIWTVQTHAEQLRKAFLHSVISSLGQTRPLGDFLIPSTDYVDVEPEVSYRTAGIYSYGRGLFSRPSIIGSETKYKKYNRIHKGQFIYSKLFGWEGALAIVGPEFDGYYVSSEFPTFYIDDSLADRRYVAHLTRWTGLHTKLRDRTTGMGSRRQRVNPARLLSTSVPLPELMEQRRIATLLDKVEQSKRLVAHQEAQMKSLDLALLNAAFNGQL